MVARKHLVAVVFLGALLLAGCSGGGEVQAADVKAIQLSESPMNADTPSAPTATVNGSTIHLSGQITGDAARSCVAPYGEIVGTDPLTISMETRKVEGGDCEGSTAVWGYNTTIQVNTTMPSELRVEHSHSDHGPWTISLS